MLHQNQFNMKNIVKILSLFLVVTTVMMSCKKDKDPATADFFVGTYKGSVSYNKDGTSITSQDGKVTVTKVDDTYSFFFGSGIPDVKGVKFEKQDDNTYVSIGDGLTGIKINASSLVMLVSNDGATWTANCDR